MTALSESSRSFIFLPTDDSRPEAAIHNLDFLASRGPAILRSARYRPPIGRSGETFVRDRFEQGPIASWNDVHLHSRDPP